MGLNRGRKSRLRRLGPCRYCGRYWAIGWSVLNVTGAVCSFRCLRRGLDQVVEAVEGADVR